MKKNTVNTINTIAKKALFGNILAVALFFACQNQAFASVGNENDAHIDSTKANKLDVKYLGNTVNGLEFDVRYANLKGTSFSFIIKDETGEVLYEKSFNKKQFFKRVQMPEVGESKALSFTIVSDIDKLAQTKQININTRYFEDVYVKIN